MLNIGRRDLTQTPASTFKEPEKPLVKPQQGSAPLSPQPMAQVTSGGTRPIVSNSPAPVLRDSVSPPPIPAPPAEAPRRDAEPQSPPTIGPDTPGSKLWVGPKIKLKGVEISDCDVLVVEGEVEATVNSKAMQIAEPGTLKGEATIDVAEVYGEFSGELTARAKLIVHGTGRVSGTIRYGKLIVAEGGVLSGDVQRLDAVVEAPVSHASTPPSKSPAHSPLTSRPLG
jgi:cytoskeletal protein CcmA (bactofilin family)